VAIEAVERFGQRARIDDYDDFVHIITFGMAADGKSVAEVHCFVTDKVIISLHQGDCAALGTVCDRIASHHSSKASAPQAVIFYLIMDTHLSMVSNRLNVIMKQLAMIATIFLPLGFLTGFFGQNFSWPIAHLQVGFGYFLFLGVGSEVVAIVLLLILFKRRGWLGSGPTA
jgi:Mg2+ and Co2+ transporter CorA